MFRTKNSVQPENTEFTTIRETILISMGNSLFVALFALIASSFRTRAALQAEILALRHQLAVLQANAPRLLRFKRSDRLLWLLLSRKEARPRCDFVSLVMVGTLSRASRF